MVIIGAFDVSQPVRKIYGISLGDGSIRKTGSMPGRKPLEGGRCLRSPSDGKCLLLLPFAHPDWQPALKEEFDTARCVFRWRDQLLPAPVGRSPLTMEEVGGWGG